MPETRSLKRRRSWLEIGLAGCVMLANPAQGAWPSLGTVWSTLRYTHSTPPPPPLHQAHHSSNNHHGTQEEHRRPPPQSPSLRGSASITSPPRARQRGSSSPDHDHSRGRGPQPAAGRSLGVEVTVHGGFGDWQACSPETCTQTRTVFCEMRGSRESRIVANDFCEDELPDAERPCVGDDVAAVCGDTPAAAAAASRDAAAVGGSRDRDSTTAHRSGSGSGSRPATVPPARHDQNGGGAPSGAGAGAARGRSAAPPSSATTTNAGGNNSNSSGRYPRGSKPATTGEKEENREPTTKELPVPSSKIGTPPRTAPAPEGKDAGMSEEEGSGETEAAGDGGADSTKSAKSRKQGETPSNPSTAGNSSPKSTEHKHSLAATASGGQQLSQMGRVGPRSHRVEYRFWMVLAIGAGAVGSFMAVVVFAWGQYRKEQHRLRGIMALNEFPQDNYINPFAKQMPSDLSEDERAAFKL